MHDLQLVGFTTDRRGLILRSATGARRESFIVPITSELVTAITELTGAEVDPEVEAVVAEPVEEAEPVEPRPTSQLSVRDIQARLRSGEPARRVAAEAGVDEEWIERFAPPVRAEQRRIVEQALECHLQRSRSGPSAVPLRRAVGMAMADKGIAFTVAAFDAAWSSHLLGHDRWAVEFTYRHRGKDRTAGWVFDAATGELTTADRTASQLGYVAGGAEPDDDAGTEVDGIIGDPEAKTQIGTATDPASTTAKKAAARRKRAPAAKKKAATKKKAAGTRKKAAGTSKKAATKKKAAGTGKKAATKKKAAGTGKKAATKKKAAGTGKKAATKKKAAGTGKKAATKKKAAAPRKAATRAATKRTAASKRATASTTASAAAGGTSTPSVAPASVTPRPAPPTAPAPEVPPPVASPRPGGRSAPPATAMGPITGSPSPEETRVRSRAGADGAPPRPAVAERPGAVRLDEVPLAPASNGRARPRPDEPASAGRPPELERIPDAPGIATPPIDRTGQRRARAAQRNAPTVQFRSGSAAPVRPSGEPAPRPAPRPAPEAPGGSSAPVDADGAARPRSRRRRQLRAT